MRSVITSYSIHYTKLYDLLLSYVAGHAGIAEYLGIKFVPGSGTLAIFCGALIGGGLGFLWFNASPAQLFMGDVGSLALGGALGTMAVLIRQEFLLAIVGGIFRNNFV